MSAKWSKRKEGQQILFLALKWLTFQEIKILSGLEGTSIHSALVWMGQVLNKLSSVQRCGFPRLGTRVSVSFSRLRDTYKGVLLQA